MGDVKARDGSKNRQRPGLLPKPAFPDRGQESALDGSDENIY